MSTSRSLLALAALALAACSRTGPRKEPTSLNNGPTVPPLIARSDANVRPDQGAPDRVPVARLCDAGNRSTAVAKAAFAGDVETFHSLLSKQPSTVDVPGCQPTALMMALAPYITEPGTPEKQERERSKRKLAIAEELAAKCHEVGAVDENGRTALHSAVTAYYPMPAVLALTRRMLECGAAVDARTNYGVTPLMMAVIAKRAEVVRVLIEAGADPEARAADGESVVELAERTGQKSVVNLMQQNVADGGT